MTNEERARWLNAKLDALGVPDYGRASAIAKKCKVSHPAAVGWLAGKLSKDIPSAIAFCEAYNLDIKEWATGEASKVKDFNEFWEAIETARQFEEKTGELTPEQFKAVTEIILEDSSGHRAAAMALTKMAEVFRLPTTDKNGSNGERLD